MVVKKKRSRKKQASPFFVCFLCFLADLCVGIGYVAWKVAGGERFASGVLPGAWEGISCTNKFKVGTGDEGG